jgi:hypothetical protein
MRHPGFRDDRALGGVKPKPTGPGVEPGPAVRPGWVPASDEAPTPPEGTMRVEHEGLQSAADDRTPDSHRRHARAAKAAAERAEAIAATATEAGKDAAFEAAARARQEADRAARLERQIEVEEIGSPAGEEIGWARDEAEAQARAAEAAARARTKDEAQAMAWEAAARRREAGQRAQENCAALLAAMVGDFDIALDLVQIGESVGWTEGDMTVARDLLDRHPDEDAE